MRSLRSLQTLLASLSLTLLVGCGEITLGPRTTNEVVLVDKYDPVTGVPVKIGVVKKNVKVPIKYETDSGKQFEGVLDIGGWSVSPPPLPEVKAVPSFAQDAKPQYAYTIKVGNVYSTCFPYAGGLVTCAHAMDGKNAALVWDGSEWVDCVLTKIDSDADLAYLTPGTAFLPALADPRGDVCWCRIGTDDNAKVHELKITKVNGVKCTMKGFAEGASGAPVFVDGKLYGMARAYYSRKNWLGRWVRTDDVEVVPVETIDTFMKK